MKSSRSARFSGFTKSWKSFVATVKKALRGPVPPPPSLPPFVPIKDRHAVWERFVREAERKLAAMNYPPHPNERLLK